MIAIIDYGVGNLRSVQKGLEKAGYPAFISSEPGRISGADGLVLPGVGAFADAMESLEQMGLIKVIKAAVNAEKPFLGICLGLQLLFDGSEEGGWHPGLGIIPGSVRRLPESGLKIPHMGWNQVGIRRSHPLLEGIPDRTSFYFVHSYYIDAADASVAAGVTEYGVPFTSVACHRQAFGVQFHPEKSSSLGLKILQNFGELVHRASYTGD